MGTGNQDRNPDRNPDPGTRTRTGPEQGTRNRELVGKVPSFTFKCWDRIRSDVLNPGGFLFISRKPLGIGFRWGPERGLTFGLQWGLARAGYLGLFRLALGFSLGTFPGVPPGSFLHAWFWAPKVPGRPGRQNLWVPGFTKKFTVPGATRGPLFGGQVISPQGPGVKVAF